MKKLILLLAIFTLICQSIIAQTGGINFQGVARNATGAVLANQKINLKFSIIKTSETGTVEYTETKETTTNAQGVFAVVVGEVNATSFAAVDWKVSPKFLKVEMDAAGGTTFITMGTTRLQNVPYAYYANGVNANNIDGAVPVSKGGTGATTAADARANLGLVIGTNVQGPLTAGTDYLTPTGNAATATKLATKKKINGIDFDGSSDITVAADASTLSGTVSVAKGGTGATTAIDARANLGLVIGTNVQAPLTAGTDYLTPTGNAATATKLATARNINGVAFDGSANITVNADANTLSGTVSVSKGGTGTSTLTGLVVGNGTNSMSGLTGNSPGETLVWKNSTNKWQLTGSNNLAIGNNAGNDNQGIHSIAMGFDTGINSQGDYSIALGNVAGAVNQGMSAIAIGQAAGVERQGNGSIAIGTQAGLYDQGANSIAIGKFAGHTTQSANSIILNASGFPLSDGNISGLFIRPIRSNNVSNGSLLQYNASTSEIYASNSLTSATITDKVIVGSSSETTSTAVLEVNSTTKGFLPPRMTISQRNSIVSPALGLVIFCTDCGRYGELEVFDGSGSWHNLLGGDSARPMNLVHYTYNGINTTFYKFDGTSWTTFNPNPPVNFNTNSFIGQLGDKSYFAIWNGINRTVYSFDGTSFVNTSITLSYDVTRFNYIGSLNNKMFYLVYDGNSVILFSFDGINFTSLSQILQHNPIDQTSYIGTLNNKMYFNVYDRLNDIYNMYYFEGSNFSSMSIVPPIGISLSSFIGTIGNKSYFNAYNGSNGTINMYSFDGLTFNLLSPAPISEISGRNYLGTIGSNSYFNVYNRVNSSWNYYIFDGLNWTLLPTPLNLPTQAGGWLESYIYTGTLILNQH